MLRIAGVDLPDNKQIETALTYIYGIGNSLSKRILTESKIDPNTRVSKLSGSETTRLRNIVEKQYKIEGDLRREKMMNIKRLKDINCYRGSRHKKGLPARGQRTKTNSRTIRGNTRRTMGSGRRKTADKT